MKKQTGFFAFVIALLIAVACGTKEKNTENFETADEPAASATELTPAEKRIERQKQAAERAEKRRLAMVEQAKTSPTYNDPDGNTVYVVTERTPTFKGGDEAMRKYIQDNLQFPKEAEDKGVEGTVFVDFVVAPDGTVRQVEVSDVIGDDEQAFKDEAIRVVSSMPKWESGLQKGKPVYAKYSIPISFEIM